MNALGHIGNRRHIVVVEDDALVAAMVCDALEYAGFDVSSLVAAEDALSLAVMGVPIDLVLTDIDLAGPMDGWELGEAMREMRRDVPIVYTSGRAEGCGADRRVANSLFLAKPYSPVAICAMLRELLAPSVCKPDIQPAPRHVIDLHERRALRA